MIDQMRAGIRMVERIVEGMNRRIGREERMIMRQEQARVSHRWNHSNKDGILLQRDVSLKAALPLLHKCLILILLTEMKTRVNKKLGQNKSEEVNVLLQINRTIVIRLSLRLYWISLSDERNVYGQNKRSL